MNIDTSREGNSARLRLEGRLDREWAEDLSLTLEQLLQQGVRSLNLDFTGVTYASSAATRVLTRCQEQLTLLRGEMRLTSLPPQVRDLFEAGGWDAGALEGIESREAMGRRRVDLRQSSWHTRNDFARSGQYELSACQPAGSLTCHLYGDPEELTRRPVGSDDCRVVAFPNSAFGLGLGAIGLRYDDCQQRLGELLAAAGCVAYFPTDGAMLPDYLVAGGRLAASTVLASGLRCEGGFSQLLRFSTQTDAAAVPLSELAAVALEAVGGKVAGLVIAGETARIAGARLLRSPADQAAPFKFEVPAVRDWFSVLPEPAHVLTTTLITGVVARSLEGPLARLAPFLRPMEETPRLYGHLHAAVFSYHPLPQRTVELSDLVQGLFANHQLRDVLHLLWDDREEGGPGESALLRGVGWAGPITQFS